MYLPILHTPAYREQLLHGCPFLPDFFFFFPLHYIGYPLLCQLIGVESFLSIFLSRLLRLTSFRPTTTVNHRDLLVDTACSANLIT